MEVKAVDAARVEAIARSIGGDIMVEMMDVDELRKWNVVRSWRLLRNTL
jgi:DNA-binding transcriptional regulator YdaS (Cro superfamily)